MKIIKNNEAIEQKEPENKINKPSFLDKDPHFFNTNFSKDKENNLYFAYNSIIYKMKSDESLEILLNCKDMGLLVTKAKYFNGYIFMCVYLSDNPSYPQGILRMNPENSELKMFETPKWKPSHLLNYDDKVYLEIERMDKRKYATFDYDYKTNELSNFKIIDNSENPFYIENTLLKEKYSKKSKYRLYLSKQNIYKLRW